MRYRLTGKAEDDIVRLYIDGARMFGVAQAEGYHRELVTIFELLAANPRLARERHEITPPVRVHPHKSHLIVYVIEADGGVLAIRVRHAHEDWQANPLT